MNLREQIKIICIDLDHTLIGEKNDWTSSFNASAIIAAEKLEIKIVIVTGRFFARAINVAEQVKANYLISSTGATTYSLADKQFISQKFIPLLTLKRIVEIVRCFPHIFAIFFSNIKEKNNSRAYTLGEPNNPIAFKGLKYVDAISLEKVEASFTFPCFHILLFGSRSDILSIQKTFEKEGLQISAINQGELLEINVLNIEKGFVVQQLAARLAINVKTEIMAFGDSRNDLSLFQLTNYGIAVANAIPELKKAAFFITESQENDGVGKAIERFILTPCE